jgi:predicted Zn-ribbon and HTH transcriptional regulator
VYLLAYNSLALVLVEKECNINKLALILKLQKRKRRTIVINKLRALKKSLRVKGKECII